MLTIMMMIIIENHQDEPQSRPPTLSSCSLPRQVTPTPKNWHFRCSNENSETTLVVQISVSCQPALSISWQLDTPQQVSQREQEAAGEPRD